MVACLAPGLTPAVVGDCGDSADVCGWDGCLFVAGMVPDELAGFWAFCRSGDVSTGFGWFAWGCWDILRLHECCLGSLEKERMIARA